MLIEDVLSLGYSSISVIGLGKNTGKTFSFNQLLMEACHLGINVAMTTIGLDGEERDSLSYNEKPRIIIRPGQIVANAKSLILDSGLDYEIIGNTGIMTPLGEVILARALSTGKTLLAGPSTGHELVLVKQQLEKAGIDLLLVDGAIDRRSFAAPMVTDTTVLAVGTEVSWDRQLLLERLKYQVAILTLPAWNNPKLAVQVRGLATEADLKLALLSAEGVLSRVSHEDVVHNPHVLAELMDGQTETVYVQGMLSDEVLALILSRKPGAALLTILVSDPTSVFLGKQSFLRLRSNQAVLKVLDSIHLSAVTVNPFSSRFGLADPLPLLADVGQAVDPIPAFDLNLGIRYRPEREALDGIS
jgi:hypothetical protein